MSLLFDYQINNNSPLTAEIPDGSAYTDQEGIQVLTRRFNTLGAVPQSVRGLPGGFGGQQQSQQPTRSVAGRLPNGKMGEQRIILSRNGAWVYAGALAGATLAGTGWLSAAADSFPDSKQHLRLGFRRRSAYGQCWPTEPFPSNGRRRELCAELRWGANAHTVGYVVCLFPPSHAYLPKTPPLLPPSFLLISKPNYNLLASSRYAMALPSSKKARLVRRAIVDTQSSPDVTPERSNGLAYAAVLKGYSSFIVFVPDTIVPCIR